MTSSASKPGTIRNGNPHRLQHLLDHRLLDEQVVRRRVAVGLVVRVDLVAEGRVLVVERGDEVVGPAVVEVHERRG